MQKQMEGKNPKGNILCLNVVVYIYIYLYKCRIVPSQGSTWGTTVVGTKGQSFENC